MKPLRSTLLIFALGSAVHLSAQSNAPATAEDPAATGTAAGTAEEVNVGASSLGATSLEVAGTATGLNDVIAGRQGATAQLVPAANGSAVAVIDLAGQADLSRVSLNLGRAKGRLVIIALSEDGEQVDLSTAEGAKKLVTDKTLTGEESIVAVDVKQVKAKSVMIYWLPEEPGAPLSINQVGIFTRDAVVPDANSSPNRASVAAPPVVPSPQALAVVRDTVLPAGAAPSSPGVSNRPASAGSQANTPNLPETIPPSSRAVSR